MDSVQDRRRTESSSGTSSSCSSYADVETALLPRQQTKYCHEDQEKHKAVCGSAVSVAALILSVICLLTVVGSSGCFFFFGADLFMASTEPEVPSEEVCVPCIQVSPDPLDESLPPELSILEVRRNEDNDTNICCARTAAEYAALFKMILKRQQEVRKLADMLESSADEGTESSKPNRTAVSAHLLFKPLSEEAQKTAQAPVQTWKSPHESPLSHVREGLSFHDNMLYILKSGLYFIYCQILFNRAYIDTVEEGPQIASAYVMRNSLAYPPTSGIILKSRHTRFNRVNDRHSSYVGGLFFMHAGDQVFVKVSEPSLISNDEVGSFFGLFRVGV